MSLSELVFGCVLHLLAGKDYLVCQDLPIATEAAEAIAIESQKTGVSPEIVAAVIFHESRFRPAARGKAGELGLTQIKRNGAIQGAYLKLSDRQLKKIDLNIRIGVGYMRYSASRCKGPPVYWLSYYNGGGCRPSNYSRSVLRSLAMIKRKFFIDPHRVTPAI